MPQLAKAMAKKVDAVEIQSFGAIPGGVYEVRLDEVEARVAKSGNDYWSWALTVVCDSEGDEEYAGRKLWNNTALTEKAFFKLKEAFEAFGYETTSDTEEIVGDNCLALVSETVIEQGARKGQPGNNVERLMPLPNTKTPGESEDDEDEDVF
jgi:hypothetical protein